MWNGLLNLGLVSSKSRFSSAFDVKDMWSGVLCYENKSKCDSPVR